MEIKTKYITADDFKVYFGMDLKAEMQDNGNPSNSVDAFLLRIENRVASFINAQFYINIDRLYPTFTDYQKEHYALALLEQAMYVVRNGDISVDSGYSIETGEVASNETQIKKIIGINCMNELMLCGLWSRTFKSRTRRWVK